jgi:hypothetical protein
MRLKSRLSGYGAHNSFRATARKSVMQSESMLIRESFLRRTSFKMKAKLMILSPLYELAVLYLVVLNLIMLSVGQYLLEGFTGKAELYVWFAVQSLINASFLFEMLFCIWLVDLKELIGMHRGFYFEVFS